MSEAYSSATALRVSELIMLDSGAAPLGGGGLVAERARGGPREWADGGVVRSRVGDVAKPSIRGKCESEYMLGQVVQNNA